MPHKFIGFVLIVFATSLADGQRQQASTASWKPPKASTSPGKLGWLVGNWTVEKHYSPNPFIKGEHLIETEQCQWADGGYYVICNSKDILDDGKPVREIVTWSQDAEPHFLRFVDITPDDPTDRPTAGWCRVDGESWYCCAEPRLENGKAIHLRFFTKSSSSSAMGNSQFSEDGKTWLSLSVDSFTRIR